VQEVRSHIRGVLEPSERLAAKVQSLQAREMEAFYSFLLVGDGASRLRYREARDQEQATLDSLSTLTESMPLQVREKMANLLTLSFSWHLRHQEMLTRDISETPTIQDLLPSGYRQRLITEQAAYEEVRDAAEDLRNALAGETRLGESAMARARFLQSQYTQILVVLGLLATAVVLVLAWRLRELMRESEARRREALKARREADGLLGATGDGVLGMDLDGTCTFLNRAGAELLGYTSRAVVGRNVHDMLHHSFPDGRTLPSGECGILNALATGSSFSGRNETLWRSGGRPFPVQVSLRPVMDGGDLRGAVLSFVDMTDTRAAEASLRQALQTREEVLAVVSHDLRNPVGTIVAAASLLLTLDPSPEKRREHLLAIKRSADRINRLIQDLLDVARLEVGALSVHPGRFRVELLLQELVEAHAARAEDRSLVLGLEVPRPAPEAWGDRHRVIQALANLVENALRVTPAGGRITVRAEARSDDGGYRYSVSDTGPGIHPQDQERLFDRFWQVSRKDKLGAGLGLSIVKGIVDAHRGEVGVESEEGKGTTFWFSLPGEPEDG